MPVKEEDKGKTAFVTHRGKYEFNYLPFGVQSGPSYMMRLMDAVLQGLAWEICMLYLDDVGVWSTAKGATHAERVEASFEQMMHWLDLVLERLRWAGLTCKATKLLEDCSTPDRPDQTGGGCGCAQPDGRMPRRDPGNDESAHL